MGSGFFPQISFKRLILGGATRNRTGDEGFADLCLTAWLWRHEMKDERGEGRGERKNRNREGNKSEKSGCECMRFASAILERITGLEPATSTLARSRSTK